MFQLWRPCTKESLLWSILWYLFSVVFFLFLSCFSEFFCCGSNKLASIKTVYMPATTNKKKLYVSRLVAHKWAPIITSGSDWLYFLHTSCNCCWNVKATWNLINCHGWKECEKRNSFPWLFTIYWTNQVLWLFKSQLQNTDWLRLS